MTGRVGPKGQVVVPKAIRERLGLVPGDEVVFFEDGEAVRITRARGLRQLAGELHGSGLRTEFEKEHRNELERARRRAG